MFSHNKYIIYTNSLIFVVVAEDQKEACLFIKQRCALKDFKPKRIEIAAYGLIKNKGILDCIVPCYNGCCDTDNIIVDKETNQIFLYKKKLSNNRILGRVDHNTYISRFFKRDQFMNYFVRTNKDKDESICLIQKDGLVFLITKDLSIFGEFVSGFWHFRENISDFIEDDEENDED